ncbi:hypothetical protein AGIG_G12772 [Arapaima gigas]
MALVRGTLILLASASGGGWPCPTCSLSIESCGSHSLSPDSITSQGLSPAPQEGRKRGGRRERDHLRWGRPGESAGCLAIAVY